MRLYSRFHRILRHLCEAAMLAALLTGTAHAAQILVSTNVDYFSDGDGCSLREAVVNANTNTKQGSADCARGSVSEVDVIVLPPETIFVNSTVDVTDDVVILGGSGSWTVLDAKFRTRILNVSPGKSLKIRGVQLSRGYAADEGAAVRVQSGGHLDAEYLVATSSRIDSATAGGRGAGIYLAAGATATISRSEISFNEALGASGRGAGIYCDVGCQLTLSNTVVTGNKAGLEGGGLWVAGNQVPANPPTRFEFSTIAMNQAPSAAGMWLQGGALAVFASIYADNGSGGVGADFDCDGASSAVSAVETFIEMPGVDCSQVDPLAPGYDSAFPIRGVVARSSLPSGLQANVLYETGRSSYEVAPTKIHRIPAVFNTWLRSRIPASDVRCSGLLDQHGRKRVTGTSCDLGAYQAPVLTVWQMGLTIYASEAGKNLFVTLGDPPDPVVPTVVHLHPVSPGGGIGENCSEFSQRVTFTGTQTVAQFFINPSQVFALPGLNRSSRVCELVVEVESGKYAGATAGNIRVKVIGNPATTAKLSSPEPGYYLDFGKVPVGVGGLRSLLITPDLAATGAISVSQVTFRGDDKARFEIASPTAVETSSGSGVFVLSMPLVVVDRAEGGSAIQVRCRPGKLGDFDAEMVVRTTSPVYRDLVYGVSCSESHSLSLTTTGARISEKGGPRMQAVVSLDSPCIFDADLSGHCLVVDLKEEAGSATSGFDYRSFGGPIAFAPGETQKVIDLDVIDDTLVEGDESFGLRVTPPAGKPGLFTMGDQLVWLWIEEDDQPAREIVTFLMNLPTNADPGEKLPFVVAVHNRSTSPLSGVRVEVAVAQSMQILTFSLPGADCSLSPTKRRATCELDAPLAASLRPLGVDVDDDEAVASRKNDADWVRVYGQIVMAKMTTLPVMDIRGAVSVSARAGDPSAEGAVTHTLTIDAPPLSSLGGALWLHWALLLLLPLRRRLRETTGRKTDWFRC